MLKYPRIGALILANIAIFMVTACKTPPPKPPYNGPTLAIAQSERGVQIFLPGNALFESGKSTLNPSQSEGYIRRAAELLKEKTDKKILIEGHTDNVGSLAYNQQLSEARAASIKTALVQAGVEASRLSTEGFAFNRPVASNATEDGRQFNRRVEMIILGEKVENITKGEPANAFESAWDKLKSMIDTGAVKPVEARK